MTLSALQLGSYLHQTSATHGTRRTWRAVLIQSLGLDSRSFRFFLHNHSSTNDLPKNLPITPTSRNSLLPSRAIINREHNASQATKQSDSTPVLRPARPANAQINPIFTQSCRPVLFGATCTIHAHCDNPPVPETSLTLLRRLNATLDVQTVLDAGPLRVSFRSRFFIRIDHKLAAQVSRNSRIREDIYAENYLTVPRRWNWMLGTIWGGRFCATSIRWRIASGHTHRQPIGLPFVRIRMDTRR